MENENINILVERRNAELECLGIHPPLYHTIKKYLGLHYDVMFKNDKLLIKPKDYSKVRNNTTTSSVCSQDIARVFNLNANLATTIISEWKRDKLIFYKMSEKAHLYFKFMVLPNKPNQKVKDEFSF